MSVKEIVLIAILGFLVLAGIITFIVAIIRGEVKECVEKAMIEAEQLGISGDGKLAYAIQYVKEKYKLAQLFLNIRKFIEHIIDLSKKINYKK